MISPSFLFLREKKFLAFLFVFLFDLLVVSREVKLTALDALELFDEILTHLGYSEARERIADLKGRNP